MTVTRRMLVHVAIGTGLVVAVASVVTYRQVYQRAEQRSVEQLGTYAAERERRLEAELRLVYRNLETVRGLLLKREAEPIPADIQARWDHFIVRDPDQGWRSRKEVTDPLEHATLWGHKDLDLTPLAMHRMLYAQRVTDDLMPVWSVTFPSVYIMFPGAACVGFNPLQPYWEWETPSDYPMEEQEWYRAATPEFNPSRGFAWTGVYIDDGSQIPYASVLLPVEHQGETICTIGHDIDVGRLFDKLTRSEFSGASHIVFQSDGRLIVHPSLRQQILDKKGEIKAQDAGDAALASLYQLVVATGETAGSGYDPQGDAFYAHSFVPKANWFFVTTMPRALVRAQALESSRWVWYSGLASIALVLGTFAVILRREIGQPLAGLLQATEAMGAGDLTAKAGIARADDLGQLARAFNQMVERVANREADLRKLNASLEQRVDERTRELNVALARERELGEMKSNFVSMVSHEFRTPLGVILSAADVLERYHDQLPPEKRQRHLGMIRNSSVNLSGLIDEVLLLGKAEQGRLEFTPSPVDLRRLCHTIADEMVSATAGACPIDVEIPDPLPQAMGDESLLRHILPNLLSNAVKYSEPGSPVVLRVTRNGQHAVLQVIDHGIGIPADDQQRMFTSFTRAGNVGNRPGTGLGLVIVQRCVELHGGTVELASAPDSGTTITVTLPVFPEPNSP